MMYLTINKKMGTPPSSNTDWTVLGTIGGACVTIITIMFKWIDSSFSARKMEREAFIKAVVSEAMSIALKDIKENVDILFKYREKDREYFDRKFSEMMKELKQK